MGLLEILVEQRVSAAAESDYNDALDERTI
jgi:hypothetical protein